MLVVIWHCRESNANKERAMGRRRRDNFFTDIMAITSKLPWMASLLAAVVSAGVLHWVAVMPVAATMTKGMADLGPVVVRQMIHTFAFIFQFVVPIACVIGAAVSFYKQRHSVALYKEVKSRTGRDMSSISWQEFETLVADGFRQRGFKVAEKGGAAPDGGVDLVLSRGRDKYLVQCKQWRARQVGVLIVRELYGVMTAARAAGGYVVTSGHFTADAKKFASGSNIELIDGEHLDSLLREPAQSASLTAMPAVVTGPTAIRAPLCPSCQTPMVARVAKQGPNAGMGFWGCGRYPTCRGTLPKAA